MIIVRLMGGLGNQMFQYAFGRSVANRNNTELKLDVSFFDKTKPQKGHVVRNFDLDIFNIKENFASPREISRLSRRFKNGLLNKIANKILGQPRTFITQPHFHFSPDVYYSPDNVYLSGYWQTEKYFKNIESLIRSEFTFKEDMSDKAKELLAQIRNSNSVCVNVRRGDFLTNDNLGFQDVDYFEKAEKIISERVSNPIYFVFSDEIEWCENHLKFLTPAVFVSHTFAGRKFQDYLRLMSGCKHFIIPNSSFAWWAVWFNQEKERIVIAPAIWFKDSSLDTKDLIPLDWIRV